MVDIVIQGQGSAHLAAILGTLANDLTDFLAELHYFLRLLIQLAIAPITPTMRAVTTPNIATLIQNSTQSIIGIQPLSVGVQASRP